MEFLFFGRVVIFVVLMMMRYNNNMANIDNNFNDGDDEMALFIYYNYI